MAWTTWDNTVQNKYVMNTRKKLWKSFHSLSAISKKSSEVADEQMSFNYSGKFEYLSHQVQRLLTPLTGALKLTVWPETKQMMADKH